MDMGVAVRQKARVLASVRQKQSHKHVFKSEADARREKTRARGAHWWSTAASRLAREPPQRK